MQCDWRQILAHVSPLPDSRKLLKDAEEFPGDQTYAFLQKTADCEKTRDCEGKTADRKDPDILLKGSQLFTQLLTCMSY